MSVVSRHHTHITHITITTVVTKRFTVVSNFFAVMMCDDRLLKCLHIYEMLVIAIFGHKLIVLSLFNNLAFVYNADEVGIAYGR